MNDTDLIKAKFRIGRRMSRVQITWKVLDNGVKMYGVKVGLDATRSALTRLGTLCCF